jgi:hypothetical protein
MVDCQQHSFKCCCVKDSALCILWCLWRVRNDRSLEDHERTLEKIEPLFFSTLYLWTYAFVSPLVIGIIISFFFFFFLFFFFFFFLLARCSLFSVYLGASYTFNDFLIIYQKKKLLKLVSTVVVAWWQPSWW